MDDLTIPFDALKYLTGECNYGGRVTDDKDRLLMVTLLEDYYNKNAAVEPMYQFSIDPSYYIPSATKIEDFTTGNTNIFG